MFGYRPDDVDRALAARDGALAEGGHRLAAAVAELDATRTRIIELELVADRLTERAASAESELQRARTELDRLRAESADGIRALAVLAAELEGVRSQARGQATRIRMAALGDAAGLSERIEGFCGDSAERRARVLGAVAEALARVEADAGEGVPSAAGAAEAETEPQGPETAAGETAEVGTGLPEATIAEPAEVAGVNGKSAERIADDIFVGAVEVEIGPLSDFSQLVGFEDAANAIGATAEISVTRFAQGRATLAMKLAEPVELLRELEERAPFEFQVRDTRADRLVLDVDAE